jgi:two-component system chemotaxis sensor kinase CheA
MRRITADDVYSTISGFFYRVFIGKRFLKYRDTQQSSRYLFMNYLFLIAIVFFTGASAVVYGTNPRMSLQILCLSGVSLVSLLLMRLKLPLTVSGFFFILPFGFFCAYLTHLASPNDIVAVWCVVFPIVSIFLLGIKYGVYLDIIMGSVLATIIFTPEFSNYQYDPGEGGIFFFVYVVVTVITITSELISAEKEAEVNQLNIDLQQERDELTTMKDNLNVGIFMLDQSFIIQPYYSHSLEDILSHSNLAGMSILDVFIDSITSKQRNTLKDYFSMMFNMTHNMKLLEEINPIHEVEYVSAETRAKRILSCRFSCIQRQDESLLLGTIYDITEQVKTERQLKQEGDKRQAEMKALFEIIQVDPAVFDEFIEDTDYQFDRLNTVLKRQDIPQNEVIVSFYQSIHAIKSNAAILGLEGFAEKCHALEDEIKDAQNKKEIKFEDLLHLTMELEKLFVERDKLEQTLGRITSFRKQSSTESVFIISVRRALDKVAEETGKQVLLNAQSVDDDIIRSEMRNIIKEIVLQFARNAVYHGIEDPETRESFNKDPQGTVTLTIKKVNDAVEIVFADDGKGLNMNAIKEKAVNANLIPTDANKNQILSAIFMPGFSTAKEETMSAGRGIGLSLVAERLKEVKGKMSIATKEGAGTTFTLHIPCQLGNSEEARKVSKLEERFEKLG